MVNDEKRYQNHMMQCLYESKACELSHVTNIMMTQHRLGAMFDRGTKYVKASVLYCASARVE